jgi:hypothetical protein
MCDGGEETNVMHVRLRQDELENILKASDASPCNLRDETLLANNSLPKRDYRHNELLKVIIIFLN